MFNFRQKAEQEIDREAERRRQSQIARRQTDLEILEGSKQASRERDEKRAAYFADELKRVRKQAVETFGEIGEEIDLRIYHLLSLEGRRTCFLFESRDRLEDAREVAEGAGLGVDGYGDHIPVTGADLPNRWGGQILAVEPTNDEIFTIARRLDERAKKAARA